MESRMLNRVYDNDIGWMVEAYAEYVYRLAYELTCDPIDAEDVTYAAFLSARELCGHISERDGVTDILYAITSAVAHERLASNLSADRVTGCVDLADDFQDGRETYLDASLSQFRPGLEAARAALASVFGQDEYGI